MRGVWGQLKQDLRDPAFLASVAILAAFLTIAGPFGSYVSMDMGERIEFWVPVTIGGAITGLIIDELAKNRLGREGEIRTSIMLALLSAVIAAWPLYALMYHFIAPSRIGVPDLLETGLLIFFAHLGVGALRRAWKHAWRAQSGPAIVTPVPQRLPPFVSRLAAEIQAEVAVISGRDHRIDVTTELGTASLFMRFSDAVSQMDPSEGMQVHRSHWVAFRRMTGLLKEGQRQFLVLDNGDRVPISKSHVESLRRNNDLPCLEEITEPLQQAAE